MDLKGISMITTEYLKEHFLYENGQLIRIKKVSKASKLKHPIGKINKNGYVEARIGYNLYRVHRLIWLWHGYKLPKMLDHINGDKSDNRIENLREATRAQNEYNKPIRKTNKSGYKGVYWNKQSNKWRVRLKINNKHTDFGQFDDIELAGLVATEVRSKYHGAFFK